MPTPEISSDAVGFTFYWPADATRNALLANQVALTWDAQTQLSYLTFGNVPPPILTGPEDAADLFARTQGRLPIQVQGSVVLTPKALGELRDFINNQLGQLEELNETAPEGL